MVICLLLTTVSLIDANVQETLIGITRKDFIILGADSSISSEGYIAWTARVDTIAVLGPIAAAAARDIADSDRPVGMLRVHYNIRDFETSVGSDVEYLTTTPTTKTSGKDQDMHEPLEGLEINGLTVKEFVHLARYQIAESLRSRNRLNVCLLIAGMSKSTSLLQVITFRNGCNPRCDWQQINPRNRRSPQLSWKFDSDSFGSINAACYNRCGKELMGLLRIFFFLLWTKVLEKI